MITCLYFAIGKTMTKIDDEIRTKGIGNTGLNAVNFLLLTDENMFKFDKKLYDEQAQKHYITQLESSLKGYGLLVGFDSSGTYDESTARSPWFANWQKNTFGVPTAFPETVTSKHSYLKCPSPAPANFNSRFPVPNVLRDLRTEFSFYERYESEMTNDVGYGNRYSSASIAATQAFIQQLTKALKQMSYYYGIVFTWSYHYTLSSANDKKVEIQNKLISIVDIPKLSKKPEDGSGTVGWHSIGTATAGTYNTDYVSLPTETYNIPSTMHIDSITNKMAKVTYKNCTLSTAKIMTENDKYNETSVMTKVHNSGGKYFQFRFKGEVLKLPAASDLVNPPANAKWRLVGQGTDYNLGANYNIESEDDVIFYLVS